MGGLTKWLLNVVMICLLLSAFSSYAIADSDSDFDNCLEAFVEQARNLREQLDVRESSCSGEDMFTLELVNLGKQAVIDAFIAKINQLPEETVSSLWEQIRAYIASHDYESFNDEITIGDQLFRIAYCPKYRAVFTLSILPSHHYHLYVFDPQQLKSYSALEAARGSLGTHKEKGGSPVASLEDGLLFFGLSHSASPPSMAMATEGAVAEFLPHPANIIERGEREIAKTDNDLAHTDAIEGTLPLLSTHVRDYLPPTGALVLGGAGIYYLLRQTKH